MSQRVSTWDPKAQMTTQLPISPTLTRIAPSPFTSGPQNQQPMGKEKDGVPTLASESLTPCTGTQRAQRWQRPSSMCVRSCLPGRWRGVLRKAIGGENGRAVDAEIPISMHILVRSARTERGVIYHESTAYDNCRVHAKQLERICERK